MQTKTLKNMYKSSKDIYNTIKFILGYIKYIILNINNDKNISNLKNKKKIILMQTPLHGNLGDQAIAYAEKKFINENFKDYAFLEVSFSNVLKKAKNIKRVLGKDDVIFIHGGGNMGDMYLPEELLRRFIIKYFRDTKVISFPQTISFSPNAKGKRELEKSKGIYKKNKHLVLTARESISLKMMEESFGKEKVIFTPDIVLSLDERSNSKREGILTCFRNDEEQNISSDLKTKIINEIKTKYKKVTVSDTVINKNVNDSTREIELNNIWGKMKESEVVLTDRLHGMIFCAITGTPCIVFKNFNHKIISSYNDWLKDIKYIKFIDINEVKSTDEIIEIIEEYRNLNLSSLPFTKCKNYFQNLINEVNKGIKK
ncbi:polysaccharide pyruvyl transferase family protein [Peribacillus sp. NPDC097895]|uniref:polysaccharide pyruvyl transferase family protein n=1 Tax=Peribacillus sp. NPDC097895 TaxID=3390619 RepID=UPI003D01ABAC